MPNHPPLAKDTVNYVGDHVAVVVAETLDQARNAADLVEVKYSKAEVGDLLFFADNKVINHVAISISPFKRANKDLIYSGEMIHSSGTVKISNVVFDSELHAVVDNNHEKKIKLHKIMRFKSNE